MVKTQNMNIKRLLTKYSILLIIYIVLVRFIQPYGLRFYYSTYSDPDMATETVNTIQSIFTAVTFLIVNDYIRFYEFDSKRIIVHTIWDCHQNPDDLKINMANGFKISAGRISLCEIFPTLVLNCRGIRKLESS